MIDLEYNNKIIKEIKEGLINFNLYGVSITSAHKINIVASVQILQNQIELSKQLQEIENKLPYKSSGNLGPL